MLAITEFKGVRPKASPLLLRPGEATEAVDVEFRDGQLHPLQRPVPVANVTRGRKGLLVRPDLTFVPLAVQAHSIHVGDRTVFTTEESSSTLRYFNESEETTYRMGMPTPAAAPTVALGNAGDAPSDRLFSYSWKNRHGDIGGLSPKGEVSVGHNGNVNISGMVEPPAGEGWDTQGLRIVIYLDSETTGLPSPVHEFAFGTAQPINLMLAGLTPAFARRQYSGDTLPPLGIQRVQAHPNGFWVGHVGNQVRMSEVGDVSVWPPEHSVTIPAGDIVGLLVYIDRIHVFPKDSPPEVISLEHPRYPQRTLSAIPWPCVSGASVVGTGMGVFYASESGIVGMQGISGNLVTQNHFDRRSFKAFNPELIRAYQLNGVYTVFGNGRGFRLDIQTAQGPFDISELSSEPTDVKVADGTVYGIRDGAVYAYETSDSNRHFRWTSGLFRLPYPQTMGAFQVRGDYRAVSVPTPVGGIGTAAVGSAAIGDEPVVAPSRDRVLGVSVELLAENDASLFGPVVVKDPDSHPLGVGHKLDTFKVRLTAESGVESVAVARSHQELRGVTS